jgi:large subunit ribosomal protein L21
MYSIVEQGGKQYMCTIGKIIKIEKVEHTAGEEFLLKNVLYVNGSATSTATVKAKVLSNEKTDKIIVFKKKRRHNYRRKQGHRQNISVIQITEINA